MYGFPWNFIDPDCYFLPPSGVVQLRLASAHTPFFYVISASSISKNYVQEHRLTTQPQAPPVSDSFAPFGHSRTASPAGQPLGSFAPPQASLGQHPVLGF
jgi:hypothetical protein